MEAKRFIGNYQEKPPDQQAGPGKEAPKLRSMTLQLDMKWGHWVQHSKEKAVSHKTRLT